MLRPAACSGSCATAITSGCRSRSAASNCWSTTTSSAGASRRCCPIRRSRRAAIQNFTRSRFSAPTRVAISHSCGRNNSRGETAVKSEAVTYSVGGASHQGQLIYDDAKKGQPLLLMAPNWRGVTPENVAIGEMLAGKGYVVFVVDMFGAGKGPTGTEQPMEF